MFVCFECYGLEYIKCYECGDTDHESLAARQDGKIRCCACISKYDYDEEYESAWSLQYPRDCSKCGRRIYDYVVEDYFV